METDARIFRSSYSVRNTRYSLCVILMLVGATYDPLSAGKLRIDRHRSGLGFIIPCPKRFSKIHLTGTDKTALLLFKVTFLSLRAARKRCTFASCSICVSPHTVTLSRYGYVSPECSTSTIASIVRWKAGTSLATPNGRQLHSHGRPAAPNVVKGLSPPTKSSWWYALYIEGWEYKILCNLCTAFYSRQRMNDKNCEQVDCLWDVLAQDRCLSPGLLLEITKVWARQADLIGLIIPASYSLFTSVWMNSASGALCLLHCTAVGRQSAVKLPRGRFVSLASLENASCEYRYCKSLVVIHREFKASNWTGSSYR